MSNIKSPSDPKIQAVPLGLCSPPSHPTTLGNVWIGETSPSPKEFAAALTADSSRRLGSNEPRNV